MKLISLLENEFNFKEDVAHMPAFTQLLETELSKYFNIDEVRPQVYNTTKQLEFYIETTNHMLFTISVDLDPAGDFGRNMYVGWRMRASWDWEDVYALNFGATLVEGDSWEEWSKNVVASCLKQHTQIIEQLNWFRNDFTKREYKNLKGADWNQNGIKDKIRDRLEQFVKCMNAVKACRK